MLKLWSQLVQGKPNVVFQHDRALPHIHNDVTIFLNRYLPQWRTSRERSTARPPRSPHLTPLEFFLWGLSERWGLRSASAYNPEQLEGSNTNRDYKNWLAFIEKCSALSPVPSWCVHSNKWNTYWTCIEQEETLLSCFLQWCAFNFCVAITFLPIHLYNRLHQL
jgi:hypothetical protein